MCIQSERPGLPCKLLGLLPCARSPPLRVAGGNSCLQNGSCSFGLLKKLHLLVVLKQICIF